MLRRLGCFLFGHAPLVYDRLPDGTKIRGCTRCATYWRRETGDPRAVQPIDPRLRIPAREQHELRHRAVRLLRKIRITKERRHLRGIQGGKVA